MGKRTKSGFFTSYALKQMAQLLTQQTEGSIQVTDDITGSTESVTLREVVFEFLLKLCTDFQHGVCYRCKNMPLGLERSVSCVKASFQHYKL